MSRAVEKHIAIRGRLGQVRNRGVNDTRRTEGADPLAPYRDRVADDHFCRARRPSDQGHDRADGTGPGHGDARPDLDLALPHARDPDRQRLYERPLSSGASSGSSKAKSSWTTT